MVAATGTGEGGCGFRNNLNPASCGSLSPFNAFISFFAQTRFSNEFAPPRDFGTT